MPDCLELELAGEPVLLHPDRALYWPRRQRLVIADLHLGKGDVFRRAGIAVPRGGTSHDLARIDALVALFGARELFVLGDLLHGPVPAAAWREHWQAWLQRNGLHVAVVAGNHDRALAGAGFAIELLAPGWRDPPFALCHEPAVVADAHVLCGHVHPASSVPGIKRHWPMFWQRERMLVLPAFSAFTGGHAVELTAGERGLLCVVDGIVERG